MPRVDRIERRIAEVEGFKVRILRNGVDVRGDLDLPKHYPSYSRKANDSATVAEWKAVRFRSAFVGLTSRSSTGPATLCTVPPR